MKNRLRVDTKEFPRIDSHQHFWDPMRGDYGWLTPSDEVLYKEYLPSHIAPCLEKYQMDYCISVQAAPTMEETLYLLDLYDRFDFIAGVVGWIELNSDEFTSHFDRIVQRAGFIGIRPMIQDLPDDWILQPKVIDNLQRLAAGGFPVDLQARPRHLPILLRLFEQVPNLRAVVDHVAKPFIASETMHPWAEQISELANHQNVYCKLSGLITEGNPGAQSEAFLPYIEHVIRVFGYQRVMFGSDWPVCLNDGSYDDVWKIVENALPSSATSIDRGYLYGRTAKEFYGG